MPNVLTFSRLVAVTFVGPAYMFGVFEHEFKWVWLAFGIFFVACVFDFFDGFLARRWNVQSAFGAKWDPMADKALVLPLIPILWFTSSLGNELIFPALIILIREPAVDLLRRVHSTRSFTSSPLAKWKTALQMLALGLLMIAHPAVLPVFWWPGAVLFSISAGLSFVTGLDYFARVWQGLDDLVGKQLVRSGVRPTTS